MSNNRNKWYQDLLKEINDSFTPNPIEEEISRTGKPLSKSSGTLFRDKNFNVNPTLLNSSEDIQDKITKNIEDSPKNKKQSI